MKYTVIVENDVSRWNDDTGVRYHFPKRYKSFLTPGTNLIHYKGRLTDEKFASNRRSLEPHYFALSVAGKQYADNDSKKGDLFVEVVDFKPLPEVVPIRLGGATIEYIPEKRKTNYWRDGVRPATEAIFATIAENGGLIVELDTAVPVDEDDFFTSEEEGGVKRVYSNRFERRPSLRKKALAIHGARCLACEVTMSDVYGAFAANYIQIHHKRPLSLNGGPTLVDPKTDLVPLCPNCHAMVHLGKKLRSVNEIRMALGKPSVSGGD